MTESLSENGWKIDTEKTPEEKQEWVDIIVMQ